MTAKHALPPRFFLSGTHECSYLDDRVASTLFIDPAQPVTNKTYNVLARQGFRRSGSLVYRPHCPHCVACVSVRVDTKHFSPSRSHKRIWRRNLDLTVIRQPAVFRAEQFNLYQKYQSRRHPGSTMDDADPQKYIDFLCSPHVDTGFYEFRLQDELLAVAVVDRLSEGLSAVYTFYDPDQKRRGLGIYAVLWQIELCQQLELPWCYLGYWIQACSSMSYKTAFRPIQGFQGGHWLEMNSETEIPAADA